MSNQNENIKQKLNSAFAKLADILQMQNIDVEIAMNEETGVHMISLATYAEEITSYPVVGDYSAVVNEDGTCILLGHIMLSFKLNEEKTKEIRTVVNEWNKFMTLGTIVRDPENNSLHYNYKSRINDVANLDENDLVSEVSKKINIATAMATQLLAVIEKNDYEADVIYDDSDDDLNETLQNLFKEHPELI